MLARELSRAGLPAISGPNNLVLQFPLEYNASREYIEQPASAARIETLLQELTGLKCHLRVEGTREPAGEKSDKGGVVEEVQSPYRRRQAEALKEPLVRKAIERMGAQILEIDDGFGAVTEAPSGTARPSETEGE